MSDQPKDGGPAFPGLTYVSWNGQENPEGISMRDYFAAAALQGILSRGQSLSSKKDEVIEAFKYSDAMLDWRKKNP